jgi:hypothetical protein
VTTCLDEVLKFVRRDGPIKAPVCFLTIEDGGDFWETIPRSADEFCKYHRDWDGIWEPVERNTETLGKPGLFCSKIMLALFSDAIDNSGKYRDERLYVKNECNIKFYPIGRIGTSYWCDEFTEALGIGSGEYVDQCKTQRPEIIHGKCSDAFDGSQLHIIIGAKEDWISFLQKYTYTEKLQLHQYRNDSGKIIYEIYMDGQNLAFSYFDIFRRGISDQEILDFASSLSPLIDSNIKQRVQLF